MTTNNVKVKIAGHDYYLRTDDSPEYLQKIAERADFELRRIMKDNPGFGIQNASVITALTAYDEAEKTNITLENIRQQIANYVADAAKARSAKERLSKHIAEIEKENADLKAENKRLLKQIEELKGQVSPFAGEQLRLGDTSKEPAESAQKAEPLKEDAPEKAPTEEQKAEEPAEEKKETVVDLKKPSDNTPSEAPDPETDEDENPEDETEDGSGYPAAKRRNNKKKRK